MLVRRRSGGRAGLAAHALEGAIAPSGGPKSPQKYFAWGCSSEERGLRRKSPARQSQRIRGTLRATEVVHPCETGTGTTREKRHDPDRSSAAHGREPDGEGRDRDSR